ncbi:MAG: Abi family protein [Leucobacter sp.]|nr:Abi family protein [Leucobacter sp.]
MSEVKPFTNTDEQLMTLEQRGMLIEPDFGQRWLANVGYYRLSGYWYPYRVLRQGHRLDEFDEGTTFADVAALYEFDRKLRTLVHDAVERIEISLRAHLNQHLGFVDPLSYLDPSNFRSGFDHSRWLQTTLRRVDRARNRSEAITHHDANYGGSLPIWVLTEVLDFADVSKLYEALPSKMQWSIAEEMGIVVELSALSKNQAQKAIKLHPLVRWFEHLAVIRNTSAHHARLWNQTFTPAGTAGLRTDPRLESLPVGQSERAYGALTVMGALLCAASPGSTWLTKVARLVDTSFEGLHGRSAREMGFPAGWRSDPFWSGRTE